MICIHITRSPRFPIEILYTFFLFVLVCKSGNWFRGLLVATDTGYWPPCHNGCEISSSLPYLDLHTFPINVANDSVNGVSRPVMPLLSLVFVGVTLCRSNDLFTHRLDGYQRRSNWYFKLLVLDFIEPREGLSCTTIELC